MLCPKCAIDPAAHSFMYFGRAKGGERLFYSSAARARDYKETPEKLENFKLHLEDAAGGPWIWVFDCADLQFKHMSSLGFMKELEKKLMANLPKHILIVNPGAFIKAAIKVSRALFRGELTARIEILDGEPGLELMTQLSKFGVPWTWLGAVFAVPPETSLFPRYLVQDKVF